MSTCTFLSQILSRGTPGRFGNHSEFCSPSSSSLYPPVFVKVLLNKSIRTRRHRVWLPSVGTQMAWPGFQTYTHTHTHTHYDWLIQVLMVQTQQGSRAVWTGWLLRVDQAGREDQWRGTARREFLMGGGRNTTRHTDSFNQQKPKIPQRQENEGRLICNAFFIKVTRLGINPYHLVKTNKSCYWTDSEQLDFI